MNIPIHFAEPCQLRLRPVGPYQARLARHAEEVRAAQALRFEVFNVELGEGLPESHVTRLDADPFDAVCDHLVVEHLPTGRLVGTYRLQTGAVARSHLGYYSEQEFDFAPFEDIRDEMVELGRACVHREHRNHYVLALLWKGIADYVRARGGRYLCGCSSLTSQNPALGAAAYALLGRRHLAPPARRTRPTPAYACPLDSCAEEAPPLPKLLRAYLSLGATICGPPALDRMFGTIDFLTLLDLQRLSRPALSRFFT